MANKELGISIKARERASAAFKKAAGAARSARSDFSRLGTAGKKVARAIGFPLVDAFIVARKRLKELREELKIAEGRMRILKSTTRGLIGGLGRIGGILRGVLTAGIIGVTGGVFALGGAFGAMREAMEGGGGGGGASGALADVGEQAGEAASGLSQAAAEGEKAAEKIKGVFGAFGAVGEGYVQRQGKLADATQKVTESAVASAKEASEAMEDAESSIGGATQATSRFGKAVDRISAAFNRAKTIILKAIAKAITPALEKLADLLESPEFQKFVDLLAKDLAKAAEAVAKWFIKEVIPAIKSFMEKVIEAGGPVNYIKGKFNEWRATALMVLAIITAKVLQASNFFRDVWNRAIGAVRDSFAIVKIAAITALNEAATAAQAIVEGLGITIKASLNNALAAIEKGVNAAIDILKPFVYMYNAVAAASGGSKIKELGHIRLPRLAEGAIAYKPMTAVVGDRPEAITPLDELPGIIREALGGAGGGMNVYVTVPAGTTDPFGFGNKVGDGIAVALRRQGQRIPAI